MVKLLKTILILFTRHSRATGGEFNNGLPKIHEHDNKSSKGYGLIYEGKLVCFYDYECDLGDGWEDGVIHNNSEETRLKALQMGANIIQYALTQ